jgi:hypothetical protein
MSAREKYLREQYHLAMARGDMSITNPAMRNYLEQQLEYKRYFGMQNPTMTGIMEEMGMSALDAHSSGSSLRASTGVMPTSAGQTREEAMYDELRSMGRGSLDLSESSAQSSAEGSESKTPSAGLLALGNIQQALSALQPSIQAAERLTPSKQTPTTPMTRVQRDAELDDIRVRLLERDYNLTPERSMAVLTEADQYGVVFTEPDVQALFAETTEGLPRAVEALNRRGVDVLALFRSLTTYMPIQSPDRLRHIQDIQTTAPEGNRVTPPDAPREIGYSVNATTEIVNVQPHFASPAQVVDVQATAAPKDVRAKGSPSGSTSASKAQTTDMQKGDRPEREQPPRQLDKPPPSYSGGSKGQRITLSDGTRTYMNTTKNKDAIERGEYTVGWPDKTPTVAGKPRRNK